MIRRLAILAGVALCALPVLAWGQEALGLDPTTGVRKPKYPDLDFAEPGVVTLENSGLLPSGDPSAGPGDGLASLRRIQVKEIDIVGSTVFSPAELDELTEPYENVTVDLDSEFTGPVIEKLSKPQ
jgi:hypothetical protein